MQILFDIANYIAGPFVLCWYVWMLLTRHNKSTQAPPEDAYYQEF